MLNLSLGFWFTLGWTYKLWCTLLPRGTRMNFSCVFQYVSNHPCLTEGKKCSHMCVGTPPLENTQKYSFLMPIESLISYKEDFGSKFTKDTRPSYHCACPLGMVLSQNGIACIPKPVCLPKQFTCASAQNCIPMQWR